MQTDTSTVESMAAAQREAANHQLARRLLELMIFIVLIIPVLICEFGIEPFQRGFFCGDETISYPFRGHTVTPVLLGLLVGLLPLLLIIVVEFWRFQQQHEMSASVMIFNWRTPTWLACCGKQFAYFLFGIIITFDATEVGKYTIGRLRPHFFAVCQPQLLDGSTCTDAQNQHRYIEQYECAAIGFTALDVRQARLSFPSGHSSLAFYSMLYLSLYLQRKMTWRSSKLTKYFIQFVLIMMAWFTALSRVMDNWHHWSDVLVGSLIGVICALITAHFISKFFKPKYRIQMLGGGRDGLPRQDTSATLQDVECSTPPPYCINSFNNEQYCTKV